MKLLNLTPLKYNQCLISLLSTFFILQNSAQATPQTIQLSGDFLGMTPIRGEFSAELYVVTQKPGPGRGGQKQIEIFQKTRDGILMPSRVIPLDKDAVAFDVCPKVENPKVEEFLLIGPKGVFGALSKIVVVPQETILAHERADVLPRVKICFPIFSGESRSMIIPRLHGFDLYRQKQSGGGMVLYAQFPIRALARYQWPVLRGALSTTQRVAVHFEFPDVTAPDFNGDGLADLCFSSPEFVSCLIQDKVRGFLGGVLPVEYPIQVLSPEERKNTSIRVESRLVDLTGDGRPELVVAKSSWNLADIGVALYIHHQDPKTLFSHKPVQILRRTGYFGFQEYRDHDRDGLADIVAPVASTSWTDIAAAYLTKKVNLEYVWYKNKGGKFIDQSLSLHSLGYPIDFKNWAGLLGSLPVWDVRFGQKSPGVLFFPMADTLDLRTIQGDHTLSSSPHWSLTTDVGGDIAKVDLDLDQRDEMVLAFPRDPQRSRVLKYINTPKIDVNL